MLESIHEIKFGVIKKMLSDKQVEFLKIAMMGILLVTMICVGYVILKYAPIIKSDPCSLCNCIKIPKL